VANQEKLGEVAWERLQGRLKGRRQGRSQIQVHDNIVVSGELFSIYGLEGEDSGAFTTRMSRAVYYFTRDQNQKKKK
jgi:hypothetical protein